jgi:hypothetical protein
VKRARAALLSLGIVLSAASAFGLDDRVVPQKGETERPFRPQGMAEFGLGWLLLPGANVCSGPNITSCTKGDSSLDLDAWQLFRPDPRFALGAGIVLGLTPTSDAPSNDPPGVQRDHTRRYLTIEGTARYFPFLTPRWEGWVGLTSGLIVMSDRFESTAGQTDKAIVGPRGVTIRTEGFTVGLAAGASWLFAENWALSGTARYGSWFLPSTPNRDPFGDEASLRGQNNVFSLGISIGYRVPL